jgi:aryl-alcohol dehydrogenase-like predicted oxidoreductase
VIAWSPLAGGWLSGKYRRGAEIPEDSRAVRIGSYNRALAARFDLSLPVNQRKQDLVAELELVAEKAGMPLTHMANAFVLAHPAVTASIIGPRTMDQLLDLLEGADVTLEADTLDAIDEIVPPGTVVNDVDRGWTPPWMRADARRR